LINDRQAKLACFSSGQRMKTISLMSAKWSRSGAGAKAQGIWPSGLSQEKEAPLGISMK
jgi:hypothetical protein